MPTTKTKIAFFDFTGCEGCQLTVIDTLQTCLDLLDAVEIVQFREAMNEQGEDYQIAFIEGACTRACDEDRLRTIRAQAEVVVALGACAHLGGVNAIRNRQSPAHVSRYVYDTAGKFHESHDVRPIQAVITVDVVVPGCPIDRDEFVQTVKLLLQHRRPQLPDFPVCAECKLRENACVVWKGQPCLGSVTRAGCGAICPGYGQGCLGCRGLISDPNLNWLEASLIEHGVEKESLDVAMRFFLTYPLEVMKNGHR